MPERVEIRGPSTSEDARILTPAALAFLGELHTRFGPTRERLLAARAERQKRLDAGEWPDFLPETRHVREGDWRVGPIPHDLLDRRVEITGPTDRKMVINALNSGARTFMADFEDANAPTWENLVVGQANLIDAIERTIRLDTPEKSYQLKSDVAVLLVRPRGWHLPEKHVFVGGEAMSASLVDFGLYAFHNARRLVEKGRTPAFYLPKMESHLEARLWNDVFTFTENRLGVPHGTMKATVLVETILAAFEMEEILYELRDHAAGLNAGRWDYLFSIIKKFRNRPEVSLPDRTQLTMTTPFMRAYTELLVKTCHKRGAFAMGGMAAFIPNRKDAHVTEAALAKVRDDKERESRDGFDGTWVAHPDLVPVAAEVFERALVGKPNQAARQRPEVHVTAKQILDFQVVGGHATETGLRNNVEVGIRYIESWLRGNGAVAIHNLMEDAATAEISRSQVWQWVRQGVFDAATVRRIVDEEVAKMQSEGLPKLNEARSLFERVSLASDFPEFLTLPAYEHLS